MPTYGGDEVSAVVLDMGTSTTRAGYAGDDTPKVVIPTSYGYIPSPSGSDEGDAGSYYFGDDGPTLWRANMQVRSPLKESMVHDWPAVGHLMRTVFGREMRLGLPDGPAQTRGILSEHPLLVTEPSWNSKENRERMLEIAFEEFDTPAYYSVDRSVMAAFAAGKGTAVVVDIGDELTTVTPICDGFVLRKGIRKSPIAGNVLSSLLLSTTESLLGTPVYPHCLIASKHPNRASQPTGADPTPPITSSAAAAPEDVPPGVVLRDDRLPGTQGSTTTDSFLRYQKMRIMHDVKESICEVFPRTWEEETLAAMPSRVFEFPSGQMQSYGRERYGIAEVLFNPSMGRWREVSGERHVGSTVGMTEGGEMMGLASLVLDAIGASDMDMQPTLNSNILVTGGSSLLPGLLERLDLQLRLRSPATKFKLSANGNHVERRFAPWLGGSILASLGSFHQLWIGHDEYKEQGRSVVHRRCK